MFNLPFSQGSGIFRLYTMTAQQIADREILYEQGYVINELLRVNESLWDRISNTEECDEVFEWWLLTPYLAELYQPCTSLKK